LEHHFGRPPPPPLTQEEIALYETSDFSGEDSDAYTADPNSKQNKRRRAEYEARQREKRRGLAERRAEIEEAQRAAQVSSIISPASNLSSHGDNVQNRDESGREHEPSDQDVMQPYAQPIGRDGAFPS
jgi:hypothetical protein